LPIAANFVLYRCGRKLPSLCVVLYSGRILSLAEPKKKKATSKEIPNGSELKE
jgi:hypothetical protein